MTTEHKLTDTHLHAYVDNQLDPTQRAAVEAWLQNHPADALRVRHYQEISRRLRARFDATADEPLPASVLTLASGDDFAADVFAADNITADDFATVDAITSPPPAFPAWWTRVAAAVAFVCIGWLAAWLLHGGSSPVDTPLAVAVQRALEAHRVYAREGRHAVEVGAADRDHLMTWLSTRLGRKIGPADLSVAGYTFLGGRLLPVGDAVAGIYMYENAQHQRLTQLISALPATLAPAAPDCGAHPDLALCFWGDDTLTFILVGAQTPAALQSLAERIRAQAIITTP